VIRVLFVLGAAERGGAERALHALVRHLPATDVSPVVLCLVPGPFVDELGSAGVEVVPLELRVRARQVWRSREVVEAIARTARETEARIVQSSGEKMALYGGRAARLVGAVSVVWLHDAPARSPGSLLVQFGVRRSPRDAVVVPSRWMAGAFRRRLGVRAVTIPYGIDLDRLPTRPLDPSTVVGWPAGSVVTGFFGRLQRWKGPEVFVRAAARIVPRHPRARFLVVGGSLYGWERAFADSLPRLAARLGLADRICFTGHRSDALALMAGCDVVAHASVREEPLGLVVPEAMALGRAVVATRTRGPEEVIVDEATGLLVPPGDAVALADAIGGLIEDASARARLGAEASQDVRERLSATRMAEGFAALYRELTTGGR